MTSEERERFVADRLTAVRRAVQEVVLELGPEDGTALAMAYGWNAMREAVKRNYYGAR